MEVSKSAQTPTFPRSHVSGRDPMHVLGVVVTDKRNPQIHYSRTKAGPREWDLGPPYVVLLSGARKAHAGAPGDTLRLSCTACAKQRQRLRVHQQTRKWTEVRPVYRPPCDGRRNEYFQEHHVATAPGGVSVRE